MKIRSDLEKEVAKATKTTFSKDKIVCWTCHGRGKVSKLAKEFDAPAASEDLPCLICWDDSQYGV